MGMNKLRGLVMFAVLGLGALTGCGGVKDSGAPETASVEQGLKYCADNDGCEEGQGCIDSACRPVTPNDVPCGFKESTPNGTTYCYSGQLCCLNFPDGKCVDEPGQCCVNAPGPC